MHILVQDSRAQFIIVGDIQSSWWWECAAGTLHIYKDKEVTSTACWFSFYNFHSVPILSP